MSNLSEEEIIEYLESYIQFYTDFKKPEPQDTEMMKAVERNHRFIQ